MSKCKNCKFHYLDSYCLLTFKEGCGNSCMMRDLTVSYGYMTDARRFMNRLLKEVSEYEEEYDDDNKYRKIAERVKEYLPLCTNLNQRINVRELVISHL